MLELMKACFLITGLSPFPPPPLFKKGNVNDPNDYIGIFFCLSFFCDIKSKLYSSNKLGV